MITIDIVMPTGGSKGGVEYVINAWTKSQISKKYNLRIFHISPGEMDYLEGYEKQWTMPLDSPERKSLDVEYCAKCYGAFVSEFGSPDICIATWIPIVASACNIVREKLRLNYIIISWLHSGIEVYKSLGWGGIEHLLFADYHFCISKKTENDIIKAYPDAKTFVIGNPVKKPDISNETYDNRRICFVGRISKEKHLDTILKAIGSAKDSGWNISIIGDGDELEYSRKLSRDLGIDRRTSFVGWKQNPWDYIEKASIFVVASEYEGFCVTAHEASSLGMTVISTPVNGCTDYIMPGDNGYFFDGSVENLKMILDYISDGLLPICKKEKCIESVSRFFVDNYFNEVDCILQNMCEAQI